MPSCLSLANGDNGPLSMGNIKKQMKDKLPCSHVSITLNFLRNSNREISGIAQNARNIS